MKFGTTSSAFASVTAMLVWVASSAYAVDSEGAILSISGELPNESAGQVVELSLDALTEFEPTTFTTSTIWTEGDVEFTGVAIDQLLDELGVEGGVLQATAINDYSIEIPVDEALQDDGIIAYLMNGEPMSVREKGPLWIVFPFDADDKYQSETYYSRSIWQLDRITITDD